MRPGVLRVVLVASGLVSPTAVASEAPTGPSLHLEWSAPVGCPRASEVRESASVLLGAKVVGRGPATTQVKARVRASAGVFVLTIETRSPSGTDRRTLRDERCAVLAEAAAVIAAAAADPSLALPGAGGVSEGTGGVGPGDTARSTELSPGTGATVPLPPVPGTGEGAEADAGLVPPPGGAGGELAPGTGEAVGPGALPRGGSEGVGPGTLPRGSSAAVGAGTLPASEVTVDEAAASPGPVPARTGFGLRFSGVLDVGSVPGPTGGLALTGAVFGRLWRAELTGLWLASRTEPAPELGLGAKVGLFAAALRGCVVPRLRRLEVPVCGGLEGGVQRGRGVGPNLVSRTDNVPWLAVSAGPALVWVVRPRVALSLQIDLVVPLVVSQFAVVDKGDSRKVYEGAPAAGRAALAVEWRFF